MKLLIGSFLLAVGLISTSSAQALSLGDLVDRIGDARHDRRDRHDRFERPDRRPTPGWGREVYLGTTGYVSKTRPEVRDVWVGVRVGRLDGIRVLAQDDDFKIHRATVYFADGGRLNIGSIDLREGRDANFSFGRGARAVESIRIEGESSNLFGSKAQLLVYGLR